MITCKISVCLINAKLRANKPFHRYEGNRLYIAQLLIQYTQIVYYNVVDYGKA